MQRRRGRGDPLRHCALNVALYGPARRWTMTERGSIRRTPSSLAIGPSGVAWDGTTLTFDIVERSAPLPRQVRGQVRVRPEAMTGRRFTLDAAGQHRWSPLAPRAHVEVDLAIPALRWSGTGYLDTNDGDVALEDSFLRWTWSRAAVGDRAVILYEVDPVRGPGTTLALDIAGDGTVDAMEPPPLAALPPTRWRVARETRADGGLASVRATLEDTPFYARSVLDTRVRGQPATAMHESLSLTRFRAPVVQAMLPFRMPRFR